jgi:DHA1 family tetracycline resistance protein-like MFS transporter
MNDKPLAEKIAPAERERFFTAPLIIIFTTVFIDLVGFGMVIPILPFYAETPPFSATPFEIGALLSIYSWMQFFFSPILGRLSDRYGRRPILFISLIGSVVGYLVIGFAGTLSLVFLGRIISGITGGNISTAQAYVADVTTKENRSKGMGMFGAAFGLGFILGPAIGGILSKFGAPIPFFFAAGLSFLSSMGVYFLLPETVKPGVPHSETESTNRLKELFSSLRERDFGLVNLVYFFLVTAFSIMTYAFVLYTAFRYGYNAEQNGYLFAMVGIVSVLGQGALFHPLVNKFGEAPLAAFGCLLMALSFVALPFLGPDYGGLRGLVGVCILLAFGNAMASPAMTSLASKISSEEKQGTALGILQSGASLARAVGPLLGGVLLNNAANTIDSHTLYRTFWTAAAIMLAAFLIAIYSARVIKQLSLQNL